MGDKVCGLCQHYHVWMYKDELGNRWDACTRNKAFKVYSLQDACENYVLPEPINLPQAFLDLLRRYPKPKSGFHTKKEEKAERAWWLEYFKAFPEADRNNRDVKEAAPKADKKEEKAPETRKAKPRKQGSC